MSKPVPNDPHRLEIIFQCTYQAGQLLIAMMDAAERDDRQEDITCLIQGMVPRLFQLNSVIMEAAGDLESVPSLLKRMKGIDNV